MEIHRMIDHFWRRLRWVIQKCHLKDGLDFCWVLRGQAGEENAFQVKDSGWVKGRIWGSTNVQIMVGDVTCWDARLLIEETKVRKIDWDHSVKSLKFWFDNLYLIYWMMNIHQLFLLCLLHMWLFHLLIYKIPVRLLATTILEYCWISKKLLHKACVLK